MQATDFQPLAKGFTHAKLICTVCDNGIGINVNNARKAGQPKTHESRGLALLHKKINTMNELYNIDCTLSIEDLSETHTDKSGTKSILAFRPDKIKKKTIQL